MGPNPTDWLKWLLAGYFLWREFWRGVDRAGHHPMDFDPPQPYVEAMKTKRLVLVGIIELAVCATILSFQTGCATGSGYSSASVRTEVIDDDYVYYPGYEVYYSNRYRQYVYRDGRYWVRRPAPAGVSVDVLLASPSVRVDFHDAPEHHHKKMIRSYPRSWRPPANNAERREDDRRENKRDDHDHDHDRKDGRNGG